MAKSKGGKPARGGIAGGGSGPSATVPPRIPPDAPTGPSLGPGKRDAKRPSAPRTTRHKVRSAWFQARASWPLREAPVQKLVRERRRVAAALSTAPVSAHWECIGPTNIGGRVTSAVCDPKNPNRIWVGTAAGGVWFSADAGRTWVPQWNDQDSLNIGALALDPSTPNVIYCGTGEANLTIDSYPGVGLYRLTDASSSWQLLADAETTGIPRRIGSVAVDPFDPMHLRVGGIGYGEVSPEGTDYGGLFVSRDGGQSWSREAFVSPNNYWCHDVQFHPSKQGVLFATVTERGARNGIWRSTDDGTTWEQLTEGLPATDRFGRTSIAISPSDPDYLYVYAGDIGDPDDGLLGVFRSTDGGDTWTDVTVPALAKQGQASYNNTIAVHPTNPDFVVCGGVDLYRTTDGGTHWRRVTAWDAQRNTPKYAHADHHALLIPSGAPNRIFDGNDGGLDVSDDGGLTWSNRSSGLATTMFYDVDVAQSDARVVAGGSQDNGTVGTYTGTASDYAELLGGDGGWIVYDPDDPGHFFASSQWMTIYRYLTDTGWTDVSPPLDAEAPPWMAFITLDPSNSEVVFTGARRVWRTVDDAESWQAVSEYLDGSPITALDVAASDPRRVYAGTENGAFFRSTDGGNSWSRNLAGATLPGYSITRIESAADNADLVFVSIANWGHSHIFRSQDGGISWEDADGGKLPDVPHHAVVMPPDLKDTVFVCGDAGVYVSSDLGKNWANMTGSLPAVMVIDLVYHRNTGVLYAATYGRSLWRIRVR